MNVVPRDVSSHTLRTWPSSETSEGGGNTVVMYHTVTYCAVHMIGNQAEQLFSVKFRIIFLYSSARLLPYFSIDNADLMYNAHPKLFRHSF